MNDEEHCTCCDTLRGIDTYGCPRHDVEPDDPDPAYLLAGWREVLQEQIL